MIDATQLLLGLVIITLTAMLAVIGFQVANILRALRFTIDKMNKVLDDTGIVSESISKPINLISSFVQKKFKL
ncbi:MAG: hypothetical protein Q7S14_02645 [bacterium]|nr:hypothetical protein [bacterium]